MVRGEAKVMVGSQGENRVMVMMTANVTKEIAGGRYTFDIWYSGNGDKIEYRGPYDICCNFFSDLTCRESSKSDCPRGEGPFSVTINKPLYKELTGVYEATIKIFDLNNEELLCVDFPFYWKSNSTDPTRAIALIPEKKD